MSFVLDILRSFTSHDTLCLQKFETIICAGLESSHRQVANSFMGMWNSTFGLQESLVHTKPVSHALGKSIASNQSHGPGSLQSGASEVCLKVIRISNSALIF